MSTLSLFKEKAIAQGHALQTNVIDDLISHVVKCVGENPTAFEDWETSVRIIEADEQDRVDYFVDFVNRIDKAQPKVFMHRTSEMFQTVQDAQGNAALATVNVTSPVYHKDSWWQVPPMHFCASKQNGICAFPLVVILSFQD